MSSTKPPTMPPEKKADGAKKKATGAIETRATQSGTTRAGAAKKGTGGPKKGAGGPKKKAVTLKAVAEHVGLSPATVSLVLNRSPVADSIPKETHDRVFAAARELDYRPNYLARSLRRRRSHSIGVLMPEINDAYASSVMEGIEDQLLLSGYFYLIASHRASAKRLSDNIRNLQDRSVEGFLLLATPIDFSPQVPTVAISSHSEIEDVVNVLIDHDHATHLALDYLQKLGHERIAFFKGQPESSDTEDRWRAMQKAAGQLGLEMRPELTLQLSADPDTQKYGAEEGYREGFAFGKKLLDRGEAFTTLFAFNDVSAIGAMRAFLDAGLRVPEDVSVMGFDDIQSAAFMNPSLTTVRQPLNLMGRTASRILLERIEGQWSGKTDVTVETELVIRESTAPAPAHGGRILLK